MHSFLMLGATHVQLAFKRSFDTVLSKRFQLGSFGLYEIDEPILVSSVFVQHHASPSHLCDTFLNSNRNLV